MSTQTQAYPSQQPTGAATGDGSEVKDEKPKRLTKPFFKETKPLDPNVVGKEEAKEAAENQKKAKEQYEKDLKAYEEQQKADEKGADASAESGSGEASAKDKEAPKLDPKIDKALDNLYSVLQVPDKDTIKAAITTAMASKDEDEEGAAQQPA